MDGDRERKYMEELFEFEPELAELVKKVRNAGLDRQGLIPVSCDVVQDIFTQRLACFMLNVEAKTYRAWRAGTLTPNRYQLQYLQWLQRIGEVLTMRMTKREARSWMISYDTYLCGVPAEWFQYDPEFVHSAALSLLTT